MRGDTDGPEPEPESEPERQRSGPPAERFTGLRQPHAGCGRPAAYGSEKSVRDLRVRQILEGTDEIMRLLVARSLPGAVR